MMRGKIIRKMNTKKPPIIKARLNLSAIAMGPIIRSANITCDERTRISIKTFLNSVVIDIL